MCAVRGGLQVWRCVARIHAGLLPGSWTTGVVRVYAGVLPGSEQVDHRFPLPVAANSGGGWAWARGGGEGHAMLTLMLTCCLLLAAVHQAPQHVRTGTHRHVPVQAPAILPAGEGSTHAGG